MATQPPNPERNISAFAETQTSANTNGHPLPWWTWPTQRIGRFFRRASTTLEADCEMVHRMPAGRFLPWAALAIAVVFSLFRFKVEVGPWALGFDAVYTESLWFMFVALLFGLLAPSLGIFFLACHGIFDLLASINSSVTWAFPWVNPRGLVLYPWAIAGRLVSYWLLWLLIFEVPLAQRRVETSVLRRFGRERGSVIAVAAGTLMVGALVLIWTFGVPILIRPVFTWAYESLTVEAISPLQNSGWILAGVALILCMVTSGIRSLWGTAEPTTRRAREPRQRRGWALVGKRLLIYVLLLFALGGIITKPLDIGILFGALLLSRPLAWLVLRIGSIRNLLGRIPYGVRFLLAVTATFLVGKLIVMPWYREEERLNFYPSTFFPIVLSVAVAILIFAVFLNATRIRASQEARTTGGSMNPRKVHSTMGLVIFFAIFFGVPVVALAHDCSGQTDCAGTGVASTILSTGAAALAAGAAAGMAGGGEGQDGAEESEEEASGLTGFFG